MLEVLNTIPSTSTRIPPAVPIRLITALALLRRGFTVTSGIKATAGERKVAMAMSTTHSTRMNSRSSEGSLRVILCAAACRAGTT